MNYEEIRKFAIDIDLKKVDPSKRHLIKCFRDMIIEQTGIIFDMENRAKKFKENIANHIFGLEKLGILFNLKESGHEQLSKGTKVAKEG